MHYTSCSISGTGGVVTSPAACAVAGGTGVITAFTAFNVGNVAPGAYTVTVKGDQAGDSATATFTVTSTTPTITLTPNSGPVGTLNVAVSGNGFALSDTTCTISGTTCLSTRSLRDCGWRSNSFPLQCC